jgi:hypothetical protein
MKRFQFGGYTVVLCASMIACQSQAGLVGQPAQFTWLEGGSTRDASSFLVSSTLVEYYRSSDPGELWAAFSIDFRESSMILSFDSGGGPPGSIVQGTFFGSNQFTLSIPTSMAFSAFTFGSSSNVANLSASDLSFVNNALTIDMSGVVLQQPGATFTLNYTTVPTPSGVALLFGCGLARFGRKRRC